MLPVAAEVLIIAGLLLINGVLAMSEMAVVAARRARLQQRAEAGDSGAAAALAIQESPTRFLSTVQIGITLVGILAGAFGGATIADTLGSWLHDSGLGQRTSSALGVALVVVAITYFSLVIGELAPKRFALQHAEAIASRVAAPMRIVSTVTAPLVLLLSVSTETVLRVLRVRASNEPLVTEEEIRLLIRAGTEAGIVHGTEQDLVTGVFRLGDLTVEEMMTPRTRIVWLDLEDPDDESWRRAAASGHTWYPAGRGSLEEVAGVVSIKNAWNMLVTAGRRPALAGLVVPGLFVPEGTAALALLDSFRQRGIRMALVVDEFGGIEGMVTLTDVLEAIVGELPEGVAPADSIVMRDDGSILLDGLLTTRELNDRIDGLHLPAGEDYHTLGGFVISQLGRIPAAGDHDTWGDWVFEVMDMDGRRVDRVLLRRAEPEAAGEPE